MSEKWEVVENRDEDEISIFRDGMVVLNIDFIDDWDVQIALANHTAACLNACEEIRPEMVPEMLMYLKQLSTMININHFSCDSENQNRILAEAQRVIAKATERTPQ